MMQERYGRFMPGHHIAPVLDAIDPDARLASDQPLVAAYLGGRPVVLARRDPSAIPTGFPRDMMTPVTVSRLRRAIDIERGRASSTFDPSLVDDWPLTHMPIGVGGVAGDDTKPPMSFAEKLAIGVAVAVFIAGTFCLASKMPRGTP